MRGLLPGKPIKTWAGCMASKRALQNAYNYNMHFIKYYYRFIHRYYGLIDWACPASACHAEEWMLDLASRPGSQNPCGRACSWCPHHAPCACGYNALVLSPKKSSFRMCGVRYPSSASTPFPMQMHSILY